MRRLLAIAVLVALVALPLALRERSEPAPAGTRTLVIITPHGEAIRSEFARGFAAWIRRERGVEVIVDWRTPGGTSEISRYLDGRYRNAFGERFPAVPATGFDGAKPPPTATAEDIADHAAARSAFLDSDVGVGIDLFFGGGQFPHQRLADRGYLVDAGLIQSEPGWFAPEVIPQLLSGEVIYDPKGRYYGACLAVFGIAWSPDRIADLGVAPPQQWADLGEPAYFRQLTLTDPTKSGAAVTALERIIQQRMAATVVDGRADLERGWSEGLDLIRRLVANSRWVTDSASKPTRDTVRGDCAASMAIDFQAKLEAEHARGESGGADRLRFTVPVGGTSVSADPIALLRGAPERALAIDFIRFVLSPDGQRLWNYRVGAPGGPQRWALRRLPVRRDVLDADWHRHAADADIDPFALAETFTYQSAWTQKLYNLIGPLTRAVMFDVRDELQDAWAAIIAAGGPERVPEAWREFQWQPVAYGEAAATLTALADARQGVPLLRRWTSEAQQHLRAARALAEAGR